MRWHGAVTNVCQIESGYYCFLNYTSTRTSAELLISVYCLSMFNNFITTSFLLALMLARGGAGIISAHLQTPQLSNLRWVVKKIIAAHLRTDLIRRRWVFARKKKNQPKRQKLSCGLGACVRVDSRPQLLPFLSAPSCPGDAGSSGGPGNCVLVYSVFHICVRDT